MSNFLSQVTNAPAPQGIRVVIAGVEKVGKTTLSTDAPNCLLVPLEVGSIGIGVNRTPMMQSYVDFSGLLDEIIAAAQAGRMPRGMTLTLDSATALERMIHEEVLRRDPSYQAGNKKAVTMESALGGYGKAYTYANELFENVLKRLDMLAVYAGINIVFTCHVFAAKVIDPANGEYDSWDLLLHSPKNQKTYGKREIITQWADMIGFLHEPMYIMKAENVNKGVSANKGRILGVSRVPSYVAGNRFGMVGEIPIPPRDGWNHIANAIYQSSGIDVFKR